MSTALGGATERPASEMNNSPGGTDLPVYVDDEIAPEMTVSRWEVGRLGGANLWAWNLRAHRSQRKPAGLDLESGAQLYRRLGSTGRRTCTPSPPVDHHVVVAHMVNPVEPPPHSHVLASSAMRLRNR